MKKCFYLGDYCQKVILESVWDKLLILNNDLFQPRASHKAILINNRIWTFGGYTFNNKAASNDIVMFDLENLEFHKYNLSQIIPNPRYDHSIVYFEVIEIVLNWNTVLAFISQLF